MGGLRNSQIEGNLKHGINIINYIKKHGAPIKDSTVFELGTGWQPVLPIMISYLGVQKVICLDNVTHLRLDMVRDTVNQLSSHKNLLCEGLDVTEDELIEKRKEIDLDSEFESLLDQLNLDYLSPVDAANTYLDDNSIDWYYSLSVLEHISEGLIPGILEEAHRIIKPGGLMCHTIGLHDHFISFDKSITAVNFLKYSDPVWKIYNLNKMVYLNRLRNNQYIEIISKAGFEIVEINAKPDEDCLEALKTMTIAKKFRTMDLSELAIIHSEIVARKK